MCIHVPLGPRVCVCVQGVRNIFLLLKVHTLNTLAVMLVGEGKPGRALQLLGEAVCSLQCPPSTLLVYNHCLLQCQVGRVGEAAQSWLEQRDGGVPLGAQEARRRVGEARRRLHTL